LIRVSAEAVPAAKVAATTPNTKRENPFSISDTP
jgi:hypothetical protein